MAPYSNNQQIMAAVLHFLQQVTFKKGLGSLGRKISRILCVCPRPFGSHSTIASSQSIVASIANENRNQMKCDFRFLIFYIVALLKLESINGHSTCASCIFAVQTGWCSIGQSVSLFMNILYMVLVLLSRFVSKSNCCHPLKYSRYIKEQLCSCL